MARRKTQSSASGTPRENVEETRRAILRTAQHLFMEHGYRAVSTRRIADACGLTQPALYHHFADKRDLYLAVMREDTAAAHVALERIARRDESAEARLLQVARYLKARTQHDLAMMLHDIRYELDAPAQQELRDLFYTGHIAPLASIFADGVRRGELRAASEDGVDPVTAAFLFLNMLSFYLQPPSGDYGAATHATHATHAANATHPPAVEHAISVLLHGLGKPVPLRSPAANSGSVAQTGDDAADD